MSTKAGSNVIAYMMRVAMPFETSFRKDSSQLSAYAEGMKYVANMFLADIFRAVTPEMYYNLIQSIVEEYKDDEDTERSSQTTEDRLGLFD